MSIRGDDEADPTFPREPREQLRRYYPAFLKLSGDVSAPWLLDLWSKLPMPA